ATAFAMAVDAHVSTFLEALGHDGGYIVNPLLPEPLGRRGHHVQECALAAMALGHSATPFELFPQSVALGGAARVVCYGNKDADHNWAIFANLVANSRGVITGEGHHSHHAVAYDHGRIYDPDGREYDYSRKACEVRGFYTQTLWRVARYLTKDITEGAIL
ncbi:MAG: hypothetical protein ACREJM_05645, partial [Candidatus Saccharimonadales bacterium]